MVSNKPGGGEGDSSEFINAIKEKIAKHHPALAAASPYIAEALAILRQKGLDPLEAMMVPL